MFIKGPQSDNRSISGTGREGQSERENIQHMTICPYRGLVLVQHLVVSAERHAENNSSDVLKTVDPLLPLRPLTSHIKQPDWGDRRE